MTNIQWPKYTDKISNKNKRIRDYIYGINENDQDDGIYYRGRKSKSIVREYVE